MITNVPLGLVRFLQESLGFEVFVETGTGFGRTTRIIAGLFPRVYTIEVHKERLAQARANLEDLNNITFAQGNSRKCLHQVLELAMAPAVVFLDAHCAFRPLAGPEACPLLDEITLIEPQHIVLVDDVRFYQTPPPLGVYYERDDWPELIDVLKALEPRYSVIYGNCIVSIPRELRKAVDGWIRVHMDYGPFAEPLKEGAG